MKKKICLVMLLAVALFIGIRTSNAAEPTSMSIPGSIAGEFDCTTGEPIGNIKKTTCTIKFKASQTTTISGSDVFEVKYKYPHSESAWRIVSSGDLGIVSNEQTTSTGGTFTYTYSGTIEKDKVYNLLTIEFTSNKDLTGEQCGGDVYSISNGDTTSNDKTSTVDDEGTGVSVPVAIIGIGAVAGLAIYSVSSRKTKFHRI